MQMIIGTDKAMTHSLFYFQKRESPPHNDIIPQTTHATQRVLSKRKPLSSFTTSNCELLAINDFFAVRFLVVASKMPLPDTAIIPPQMVYTRDQLEVGKLIGSSGGTRVHKGVLIPRAMHVAIKHLCGEGAVDCCQREVAALQKLDHINIIKVLGYCTVVPPSSDHSSSDDVEEAFMLLELSTDGALISTTSSSSDKTTNKNVGAPQTYLRLLQRLRWCLQVAEGLKYIHENDLLHLDIKPANILRFGETVKLCDFGIAKNTDTTGVTKAANRHTIAYAAPELMLGQQVSAETDLYSLGALLCELLTGQRPWGSKDESQIQNLVKEGSVPDVDQLSWPPFCAEAITQLAKKLMSIRSTDRGSIVDAIAVLQETILELVAPKIDAAQLLSSVSNHLTPGWLQKVDAKPTLLDALLCLVGVDSPTSRPDLVKHAKQLARRSTVKSWLEDATEMVGNDDDARVMILYTVESPICYVVNGALSHVGCTPTDLVKHVSPFVKRLYSAVQKLGRPYRGRGFCALYADAPPLSAAFDNYKAHFAKGNAINLFQLLSFTREPAIVDDNANSKRSMIILRCDDLIGFDIDDVSFQALSGAPASREREVIVLPPAYFTVTCEPYKLDRFVHVDLVFHESPSRAGSYMPPPRVEEDTLTPFDEDTATFGTQKLLPPEDTKSATEPAVFVSNGTPSSMLLAGATPQKDTTTYDDDKEEDMASSSRRGGGGSFIVPRGLVGVLKCSAYFPRHIRNFVAELSTCPSHLRELLRSSTAKYIDAGTRHLLLCCVERAASELGQSISEDG